MRRGESVVAMGWLADSPQGSNQREFEAAADDEAKGRHVAAVGGVWLAGGRQTARAGCTGRESNGLVPCHHHRARVGTLLPAAQINRPRVQDLFIPN